MGNNWCSQRFNYQDDWDDSKYEPNPQKVRKKLKSDSDFSSDSFSDQSEENARKFYDNHTFEMKMEFDNKFITFIKVSNPKSLNFVAKVYEK